MITKLYSNNEAFEDITFNSGLNVVLGEIKLIRDYDKDTHNLGKSTLCQVLDFCLLKKRDRNFFLFKHEEVFRDFIFYLDLRLADNKHLIIRRSVAHPSKIWLKVYEGQQIDGRKLVDDDWSHRQLPFDRAKTLIDGYLNFQALQPWNFRKVLSYLLRGQLDFAEVFRPSVFRGKDRDWKPFLLHILGFNFEKFELLYNLEDELEVLRKERDRLASAISGSGTSVGEMDALLAIRQRDVNDLQHFLDEFKLESYDNVAIKELVDDLDIQIAELNDRRYELRYSVSQIEKSLEKESLLFSTEDAEKLFKEAGVLFEGQIKRSFNQLIEFNINITEERRSYLKGDLDDSLEKLKATEEALQQLDNRRSKLLNQLNSADAISKYKAASDDLIDRKTELETLKRDREHLRDLQQIEKGISSKESEISVCKTQIQEEIEKTSDSNTNSFFSRVRNEFDDIILRVIDQHGMLSVDMNEEGHANFKAELLSKRGITTNQDEGATYKKLMCIAFDLALLLAHDKKGFPGFVYHDDAFGALDNRKKENLREVMRSCADKGLQQIVTAIDSELPSSFFDSDEIILRLHDDGNKGRLFKLPEW